MTADQAMAAAESAPIGTEPPHPTGPQAITNELIDAVGTSGCGWSRKQIEILGASWPLETGWRERIVAEGRSLSGEEVEALHNARKTKRPEGSAEIDTAVALPCPWCRRLVEPVMQGGHLKEFCSKRHKNLYNAALNKLSIAYARTIRTPGSLQTWAAARVDPSQGGAGGLEAPTGPAGSQSSKTAPRRPRDKIQ